MNTLRIGSFFEVQPTDSDQPPKFSWREFYNFRNHVLRRLRRFGSAGPMGEVELTARDDEDDLKFEHGVVRHPDFFVVDDMYNCHDQISLVECDVSHITRALLETLVEMARTFQHWYVDLRLGDSGLRVHSDAILVGGRRFWDVHSLEEIADRCSRPIDYGAPTKPSDSIYKVWLELISGEFKPLSSEIDSDERQWTEALRVLRDQAQKNPRIGHSRFAYDAVRHDLHPETRRLLITRLLNEMAMGIVIPVQDAIPNIQKDVAHALLSSQSQDLNVSLVRQTSEAQAGLVGHFQSEVIVLWWANILSSAEVADGDLRRVLISELFRIASSAVPLIQLSGIFGLARSGVAGVGPLIDETVKANEAWSKNGPLMNWLERLKSGSSGYPDRAVFAELK